ncbi:MAG: hypothetical protein QFB87_02080 [Patescibacteria group bacterium]|nr:hypothetical protein [Patescibacteria group bacterium]
MRFETDQTIVTVAEANFLEELCKYQPAGSPTEAIRSKIGHAVLDWAIVVMPTVVDKVQNQEFAYTYIKGMALRDLGDSTDEVIALPLTNFELAVLHHHAAADVDATLQTAGNFGHAQPIYDTIGFGILTEHDELPVPAEAQEKIKQALFEIDLRRLSVGQAVVAALAGRNS